MISKSLSRRLNLIQGRQRGNSSTIQAYLKDSEFLFNEKDDDADGDNGLDYLHLLSNSLKPKMTTSFPCSRR